MKREIDILLEQATWSAHVLIDIEHTMTHLSEIRDRMSSYQDALGARIEELKKKG